MRKYLVYTMLLIFTSCIKTKNIGKRIQVDNWYSKKEYLNGLKPEPHNTTDQKEFQRQYTLNKALWDKAFAYLKNTDLNALPVGRYVIEPEKITATVAFDSTKNLEKTAWESHRKWIDIQYVITGEEKIGIAPVASAKVTRPYDERRDIAYYEVDGKYYVANPDKFFIFFPSNAHRPNVTTNNNKPDKKIVIKVLAAN